MGKSKLTLGLIISFLMVMFCTVAVAAAPPSAISNTKVLLSAGDQCTVTARIGLNFRTGASTQHSVLGVLKKGTAVTVVENHGDWYKVSLANGKTGFVFGSYLSKPASKAAAVVAPAPAPAPAPAAPEQKPAALTISAAASLTDAMKDIQTVYAQERKNVKLTLNFGSSGSLQQQIEQGAPVDVFISAAAKQMNALEEKKLLIDNTRKDLLKNKMALIIPKASSSVASFEDLKKTSVKVVAIGAPESVPAGKYAQEIMTKLGIWDQVKPKLVYGKDVRQVLAYVETGDADAGVVFLTDGKISDKVKIVTIADEKLHSPVVYPAAVIKDSKNVNEAKEFINFLTGNKADAVFQKYGFAVVTP